MLNQYAVDNPTLPVNQRFSHPGGMLSCSLGMPSRNDRPLATRMENREKFFANPTASSSAPYPQESNAWISNVSEHTSPHVMGESQTPRGMYLPTIFYGSYAVDQRSGDG